jgi:CRISPR-associated protein Cas2
MPDIWWKAHPHDLHRLTDRVSEVNAGVFVGNPSRRIRDRLWSLLADRIGDGQAVLVEPAANEQGWAVRTAGRDRWRPSTSTD